VRAIHAIDTSGTAGQQWSEVVLKVSNFVRVRTGLVSGIFGLGLAFNASASAESLRDALSSAYRGNPTLNAERAKLRATDELLPQALSGWKPVINAQGTAGRTWSDTNVSDKDHIDQAGVTISLNQPLFRGFKTVESTKVAEANVKAERQQLIAVEQSVLFNAVQAYANVVRERNVLALRKQNVVFLQKQLNAADARFKAGELTRTDVAQSRASLSGARGSVAVALANLKASEANYLTIMGHKPGKLTATKIAKRPRNLDSALETAQETNPNILAAAQIEDAAEHNIEVVKGDLLPSLSLQGQYSYNVNPRSGIEWSQTSVLQGVLSVPLYEGGRTYAAVRQAKQQASQNRIQVIGAVRAVRESVSIAWNNLTATADSLNAARDQVSAANLALDGVRQEYAVGSRTTIDVLNSQQAVLNSQIAQVNAQHDQLVASYQLQAAIGHLTARHLGLGNIYDPEENYNNTRGKWIGLGVETVE
jgi:outer membrane protein